MIVDLKYHRIYPLRQRGNAPGFTPKQSNEYPMIEAFIQLPVFNPNKHYTMRGLFVGSGADATRAIARETANHIPQSMKAL